MRRAGKFLLWGSVGATALGATLLFYPVSGGEVYDRRDKFRNARSVVADLATYPDVLPTRSEHLAALRASAEQPFDLVVVGGGASGCGVALDATLRGLRVALVEADDFGAGTSSRSTKLVHGGVRYLEKAFMNLDYEQYKLVVEALRERATLLKVAPHLTSELPILLPIYSWWQVPYYWVGIKMYDALSGRDALSRSYFLPRGAALQQYPLLKRGGLKGALVYYDGQHDDSRMALSLALTASAHGAVVANHVRCVGFTKDAAGRVDGVLLRDESTPGAAPFRVPTRGVVNATGPFTDSIRKMDDAASAPIVASSSGVHVVLPHYFCPDGLGLLSASSDGRVLFVLPWLGHVVAGTTDGPCDVSDLPRARQHEVDFILKEVSSLLADDVTIRPEDVLAAWAGIRPLVSHPPSPSAAPAGPRPTQALARTHVVHTSPGGVLTLAGGKWTTYRQMAEDAVDEAVRAFGLAPPRPCLTRETMLLGGHRYEVAQFAKLVQGTGCEEDVARHVSTAYGDRAGDVLHLCRELGMDGRLVGGLPYLRGEVVYAVRREMAASVVDVLARRTRAAFLRPGDCDAAVEEVANIMGKELGWGEQEVKRNVEEARAFLATMKVPPKKIT